MIKICEIALLRKKYISTSGFTLVEVITSFSIFILVIIILLKLYLPLNDLANKNSRLNLENYYIEEALNFMDFKLKYASQIMIDGNRIVYEENKQVKEWRSFEVLISNDLIWRHSKYTSGTYNYVIRNIYGMRLLEKGNLIYVTLLGKNNKEYVRCFEKVKYIKGKDERISYINNSNIFFNHIEFCFG